MCRKDSAFQIPVSIIITVYAQCDDFPAKLSDYASNFIGQRPSLILGILGVLGSWPFSRLARGSPGAGETRVLDLALVRSPLLFLPAESPTLRQQERYECSFAQRRVARAPRPQVYTSESQECTRAPRTSSCGRCRQDRFFLLFKLTVKSISVKRFTLSCFCL